MDQSPLEPSKIKMLVVAFGLTVIGSFMFLHGLGLVNADWLRPNPATPFWVFSAVGAVIFLSGILAASQALRIPAFTVNLVGYSVIFLAMILANWLVFFSEGASCGVASGNFFLSANSLICRGFAAIVVVIFDLIFILIAATSIWRRKNI